ncbi:hypothetical protein RhiirA1_528165 [Rhizophagus irregularis]|uniref:Uncharacterized protein n=1 Tax=Rhizophagus irregularis TaxID=588596 RepID=A0A2N0SKQ4_9GLOM|nr:hypothetical protein RhiirA1_528165 [Rhizophagus irregularis]GET66416.1 hypothetical protein RIR_e30235_A0A2N1M424_9GLOM [Rhizophagus irregularis DAOM 181602=DAOM 197198]
MIQILIIKLKRIKYIKLDQKNEIAGIPSFEKQIIAIFKENNTISNDKADNNIMNRKRESNNNIIDIEALYFNKFDF